MRRHLPEPLARQLRALTDSLAGAALGAAVYAAWAVWANWSSGAEVAWRAGAAHWLTSTLLTYGGTAFMRRCFALGGSTRHGAALAFGSGLALTYIALLAVHGAVGTPELALTLAPGVLPNLLFCASYAALLARTESPARAAPAAPASAHRASAPCSTP